MERRVFSFILLILLLISIPVNAASKVSWAVKLERSSMPGDFNSAGIAPVLVNLDSNKSTKLKLINKKGEVVIKAGVYKYLYPERDGLSRVVGSNGLFGFIDTKGNSVISPLYDVANDFGKNGLAFVRRNGKFGFINKSGKEVIPCIYDSIAVETEERGYFIVRKNNKYGAVEAKSGKELFPCEFSAVYNILSNGPLIYALLVKENGEEYTGDIYGNLYNDYYTLNIGFTCIRKGEKYGLVDDNGKLLLDFQYDQILDYYDDMAIVGTKDSLEANAKFVYSLIDNRKNTIKTLPEEFGNTGVIKDGLSVVGTSFGESKGVMDVNGKMIIPQQYGNIQFMYGYIFLQKDGKYGVADRTGKIIVPVKYSSVYKYNDLDFEATLYNPEAKTDYITIAGEYVDSINSVRLYDGTISYIASKSNKYSLLDNITGKALLPYEYDSASIQYNSTYAELTKGSKKYIYDMSSKKIFLSVYDSVSTFGKGIYLVFKGNNVGLLDSSGKVILDAYYDAIMTTTDPNYFIIAKFDDKRGLLYGVSDTSGKIVLSCSYADIGSVSEGVAKVYNGKLWGYVDVKTKKVIFEPYTNSKQLLKDFKGGMAAVWDAATNTWGYISK